VIDAQGRTQTRSMKAEETLTIERSMVHELTLAFDNLQKPAVGATATFMKGADMNVAIKCAVNPDVANYSDDDSTVTKMVFVTNSDLFSAVNIADETSESPIYVLYDEATTTVTVATPAPKFVMNPSSSYFFHRFRTLTDIEGLDDFDASNVETMAYFWGYSPKQSIKMPAWDYSSLINTRYIFTCAYSESIDVSNMDFSQDTSMYYMFYYTDLLTELIWPTEVDASALENMADMYRLCGLSQIDLTIFKNADGLQNIRYMFAYMPNLTKVVSDLDLSSVQKSIGGNAGAGYCFAYACENASTLDLSEFDVTGLVTTAYMFYSNKCSVLNLSNWDTTDSQSMNYMFYRMPNLGTLYLGPDFIYTPYVTSGSNPTNFTGGSSDTMDNQTASQAGALNIYCSQQTADWLSKTLLRKIYWGSYTGTPTPVTFYDLENPTVELTVTWAQ
jgi:hypothetical protein